MKPEDLLKRVGETLSAKANEKKAEKQQVERERRDLIMSIGKDIVEAISPYMQAMVERSQITKEDIKAALSEVQINIPESNIQIPEIKVPTPQVTVTVPEVRVPNINVPQTNIQYPDLMRVSLDGIDNLQPLPVKMMDDKGRPMSFPNYGGGKTDFLNIKDIKTSTGASWFNDEGLRVSGSFSVTASNSSTHIIDASNNIVGSAANPLNVAFSALATTATNIVDSSGVAYSGSNPVPVVFGASATQAVNLVDSSGVAYSGSNPAPVSGTVAVSGITNTIATANVDSSGVQYSGSNPVPIYSANTLDVKQVSGSSDSVVILSGTVTAVTSITNTIAAMTVDSSGVAYSGSNPIPITIVTSALATTAVVGDIASDVAETETNPVKIGGVARQANPSAVAAGDRVSATFDDLGRQVHKPLQVRDLVLTAYVSVSNGTETTLRAAVAGAYLDLTMLKLGNTSDAAVSVDIRAVTGGNIVDTVVVPPYGTAGYSSVVPYPQADTGNNWTIDLPDITGTTVYATALFSQEV